MTAMATTGVTREPRYLVGALCVCAALGLFSIQDSLVKWMSGSYPIYEFLVLRTITMVPILGIAAWREGGAAAFDVQRPMLMILRGVILCGAYTTFALSIATLSLAAATAIYFTLPLFVAGLSWPLLGERVPGYRWIAIIVGFGGVLVMVQPWREGGVFEPAALLALSGAFLYGLGQMMARYFKNERTSVISFYQSFAYLMIAGLLAAVFGTGALEMPGHASLQFLTRGWVAPNWFDLALMLAFGPLSAIGMPLFVHGYKSAPPSFSAAFEYTGMFWAVGLGWLIFRELPDQPTIAGAAIVVAAGLFMLYFDNRSGRL